MPNNEFQVLIQAIVDAKDVQARLNAIKNLSLKIEKIKLDQSAIDSLRNQLSKNGIDINLVLGNVNQVQAQAAKTGQQIGQKVQAGVDSVIQKGSFKKVFSSAIGDLNNTGKEAEQYFQTLSKNVSIQEKLGKNNNLDSFVISLKNADGVAEQLRYTLKQVEDDKGNIADRWFEYTGGSINDNGVIKQFKAISTAADSLQIKLNSLKANYSDLNASKAIKDSGHISSLNQQYEKVLQSILNLRNADDNTFASMQTNVKSEIAVLENMVQQFRNAEYSATSLRTKDIGTIKIDENNNLDAFVQKMIQSGHYTEQLESKVSALKIELTNVFDSNSLTAYLNNLSNLQSEFKSVDATAKTLEKSTKLQVNIDSERSMLTGYENELKESGVLTEDLKKKILTLYDSLGAVTTQTSLTTWRAELKGVKSEIDDVIRTAAKSKEIQLGIDTEKYSTQINSFQQQLSKFGIDSGELFLQASASLKQLEAAYNDIKFSDGDERLDHEKEYQKLLEKTKNLLTQVKGQKSNELISNGDNRRISLVNELNNYLQKNTAMTKQSKQVIIEWINTLNSADDMTRGTFDNLMAQFKGLDAELRAANKLGLSWADKFKQAVEKFGGWAIATGSVMEMWNLFRRMPKEVYNIDTSMTSLYKVTDETEKKYTAFLNNASSKAQDLGRSISGLVEQTADWAKLGFDIDQANELAQISSIYSNVGEVDDATAVSDLVTAMKSFNIEASDSITIVDSLNTLGNEFATDSAALGEGLKKSASALSLAGNDINQTLAMITGGTEITQNASEMGNALKVLSMRVRGMKGELEALGEEYENVESISKIQTQILNQTNGAVNIFDKNGNFKSTYEILKGISKVWSDISQVNQAALLETIAGKQRGNQISALIQAFQSGQIEKAYEASINSAGSAMQEQERWMESLEAKTQQLEAAFQSLSSTVFDSDFLKILVDSGITLTNVLDTVIDKIGVIPTLITGGSITAFIKNFDWLCNKSYLKIA